MSESSIPRAEGSIAAHRYRYVRHAWPVRLMHWVNVWALLVLLMSGLQIFNAHPALYWGQSSYTGQPPLWEIDGFPSWATLPGTQWLAMGRRWHFFFAWVFVINGLLYFAYSLRSGHLARDLLPTSRDWRSIGASIADHLRFRHARGEEARRYNVLQKLAYLVVMFGLLPFMVLLGLAMSPRMDSIWPGWVELLGGRQAARTLHFLGATALVAFVAVHLFEVLVTGLWNKLRSMITGRYEVEEEGRGDGSR